MYLLVYQHVAVQRCVQLIADLTGGTGPSDGLVHGMLTRCATAVAEVVAAITSLITLTYVVGFDETTLVTDVGQRHIPWHCGERGGVRGVQDGDGDGDGEQYRDRARCRVQRGFADHHPGMRRSGSSDGSIRSLSHTMVGVPRPCV